MHSLGLGLDLENSLDQRKGENTRESRAHTRIAELPKIKQQLILNDTPQLLYWVLWGIATAPDSQNIKITSDNDTNMTNRGVYLI